MLVSRDNVTGGHTVSTAVSNGDASVGSLMERPELGQDSTASHGDMDIRERHKLMK
jgi:hypothetical protein